MQYKLGLKDFVPDPRDLLFEKYITPALPAPNIIGNWKPTMGLPPWGMKLNDVYGICFFAAMAHMIRLWTATAGNIYDPTDAEVERAYSDCTGFDPNDPNSDQGTNPTEGLKFMRDVGIGGHKIGGWMLVDTQNIIHQRQAIDLFGGVLFGVSLPEDWEHSNIWDVSNAPIAGGHAINGFAQDENQAKIVTWNSERIMTFAAVKQHAQMVAAIFSEDFINGPDSPSGFDRATLLNDLGAV